MAQSGFLTPFKSGQHRGLRQRRAEEAGRDPAQRHHLPLRRFGPDARRDRRRRVLDRHGRLCRRQARGRSRSRHPEGVGRHQVRPPPLQGQAPAHQTLRGASARLRERPLAMLQQVVHCPHRHRDRRWRLRSSTSGVPTGCSTGCFHSATTRARSAGRNISARQRRSGPGCSWGRPCWRWPSTSSIRCSRRCGCRFHDRDRRRTSSGLPTTNGSRSTAASRESMFNNILWLLVVPALRHLLRPGHRRADRPHLVGQHRQDRSSSCRWRSPSSAPR